MIFLAFNFAVICIILTGRVCMNIKNSFTVVVDLLSSRLVVARIYSQFKCLLKDVLAVKILA